MGSLSDFAENALLDHIMGNTAHSAATTIYIGLSTADPLDTAAGISEPSGGSYARQAITFGAAASRKVSQSAAIEFPTATGDWGTVTHYFICDEATNDTFGTNVNLLAHGSLSASRAVTSGKTLSIASGQVEISVNSGAWSDYLVHKCMDLMFRNQTFTQPTIYVALVETTAISDTSTGSNIDELDMTGYAREACAGWDAASAGATANTATIDFGTLTGTGETVEGACLCDASTGGNVLVYDNALSQAIDDGDTVQFAAGAFDVTLS